MEANIWSYDSNSDEKRESFVFCFFFSGDGEIILERMNLLKVWRKILTGGKKKAGCVCVGGVMRNGNKKMARNFGKWAMMIPTKNNMKDEGLFLFFCKCRENYVKCQPYRK